jgi:hypothetical protein
MGKHDAAEEVLEEEADGIDETEVEVETDADGDDGEIAAPEDDEEAEPGDEAENKEVAAPQKKTGSDNGSDKKPGKEQSPEQTAEFARQRRERELTEAKEAAKLEGIMLALHGENPYTQKPMKDAHDVKEYLLMEEIAKGGGDPIADYPERVKERTRKEQEAAKTQTGQQRTAEFIRKDRDAFIAANPDVEIGKLLEDKKFRVFSKARVGKEPLSDIYADYIGFLGGINQEAERIAKREIAKSKASPGSLRSGYGDSDDAKYFTMEQIRAMSQEEVSKKYDKVMKSIDYHNKKTK